MIPKMDHLARLRRQGYRLAGVDPSPVGGVRVRLRRGADTVEVWFHHYEIPAVFMAGPLQPFAS